MKRRPYKKKKYEISKAKTIVVNGPMGQYERSPFSLGTKEVLRSVAINALDYNAHALIGGGDTGAALSGLPEEIIRNVKSCSSGKAFLQVLSAGNIRSLIGIKVLMESRSASP